MSRPFSWVAKGLPAPSPVVIEEAFRAGRPNGVPIPSGVRVRRATLALSAVGAIAAIASPAGAQTRDWAVPPAATAPTPAAEYRIGPLDKLKITVFQVEDLTLDKVQVDSSGQILLPLIGAVNAQGRTTTELSADIADKLRKDFLQSPQVSVLVEEAASQKVTVDGAVKRAGVFDMKGRTSLMQAVAMAEGADRDAKLRQVVVFRTKDGQRQAARFDMTAIRKGEAADPELLGGDVVVVPGSSVARTVRDVISALPAFAIFRPY